MNSALAPAKVDQPTRVERNRTIAKPTRLFPSLAARRATNAKQTSLAVGRALCALLGVLFLSVPSAAENFSSLASYRAFYVLSLDKSRTSGSVQALQGRLLWQQEGTCDGMTSSQRIVTWQWAAEGPGSLFDFRLSAWESGDGRELRFAESFYLNEKLIEESTGAATVGPTGGLVAFDGREGDDVTLERGTMFPATLSERIIATAKAGKERFDAIVYEGDSEGERFDIRVAIGSMSQSDSSEETLNGRETWPVLVSYYERDAITELPIYEISYRLYDNGISDNVVIDYGDYAIVAELKDLEELPKPDC